MTSDAALLLLLIALGAVASPGIGRLLGAPAAVVEIMFGLALGALGVGEAVSAPFIRFLADLGFALFLFLAGMEVEARELARDGGSRALAASGAAAASAALAFATCAALGWSPWVALAIGATSVPLLLAVVREASMQGSPRGRAMITMAAVGEVLTIVLVALAEVVHDAQDLAQALLGMVKLLALLGLVVLGARVLRVLRWWFPDRARGLLGAGNPAESGVRAGFGLAFAMIAAAAFAGVEPLLGAFVGGLMVAFALEDKHALEQKLGPMAYGFFVPVFFVDVGLRLDLSGFSPRQELPRVLAICGLMLAIKLLPNLAWLVRGRPLREVLATSLLLAAPLTLMIAIADLAGRLGAIDPASRGSLVFAGMLASLAYPSLARRLLRR